MSKTKSKSDVILGIGILIFVAAMWSQTVDLSESVRLFPRVILIITAFSGLGIMIKSFLSKGTKAEKSAKPAVKGITLAKMELLVGAIVVLLLLFLEVIGTYVSLFLINAAISVGVVVLGEGFNKNKIIKLLIYNFIVILIFYLSFGVLLGLNPPSGIFM